MLKPQIKNDNTKINATREGWSADEIADQSSQIDEDQIQRQMLRGDETKGNPEQRDHAGKVEKEDTPQGRQERDLEIKEK